MLKIRHIRIFSSSYKSPFRSDKISNLYKEKLAPQPMVLLNNINGKSSKSKLVDILNESISDHLLMQRVRFQSSNMRHYNLENIATANELTQMMRSNPLVEQNSEIGIVANHPASCDVALAHSINTELKAALNILVSNKSMYSNQSLQSNLGTAHKSSPIRTYESRLNDLHIYMSRVTQNYSKRQSDLFVSEVSIMVNAFATYAKKQRDTRLSSKQNKLQQEYESNLFESLSPQQTKDNYISSQIKTNALHAKKESNFNDLVSKITSYKPVQNNTTPIVARIGDLAYSKAYERHVASKASLSTNNALDFNNASHSSASIAKSSINLNLKNETETSWYKSIFSKNALVTGFERIKQSLIPLSGTTSLFLSIYFHK